MADLQTLTPEQLYEKYLQKELGPRSDGSISILFNMVATVDGVTNIKDEKTGKASDRGLSGAEDSKVMRILRSKADCILNGANTLRVRDTDSTIDKYSELLEARKKLGKPENPIAAVLTSDAQFSDEVLQHEFFTDNRFPSILFVAGEAPEENIANVKQAGKGKKFTITTLPQRADNVNDLVKILQQEHHVQTLLVEGGGGINGSFIRLGLGDHFFLTISPHMAVASPQSRGIVSGLLSLPKDNLVNLTLDSAYFLESFGDIFEHWKFSH